MAMFTPKIRAHPCRPAVTQRAVALPLVSRQAQCSVLPAPAVCFLNSLLSTSKWSWLGLGLGLGL